MRSASTCRPARTGTSRTDGCRRDTNYGGFPAVWNWTIHSGRIPPAVDSVGVYRVDDFGVTAVEHHA